MSHRMIIGLLLASMALLVVAASPLFTCADETSTKGISASNSNTTSDAELTQRFNALLGELRFDEAWYSTMQPAGPRTPRSSNPLEFAQKGSIPLTKDIGEYRFTDPIKPISELSRNEKLLLDRVKPSKDGKHTYGFGLSNACYDLVSEYGSSGKTRLDANPIYGGMAIKGFFAPSIDKEQQQLFLDPYFSPVTGKPLKYDEEAFSRGNMYLRIVTQPRVLKSLRKAGMVGKGDNTLFVYYRVYGEAELIAEGVMMIQHTYTGH
jgi:hypothetical protein